MVDVIGLAWLARRVIPDLDGSLIAVVYGFDTVFGKDFSVDEDVSPTI